MNYYFKIWLKNGPYTNQYLCKQSSFELIRTWLRFGIHANTNLVLVYQYCTSLWLRNHNFSIRFDFQLRIRTPLQLIQWFPTLSVLNPAVEHLIIWVPKKTLYSQVQHDIGELNTATPHNGQKKNKQPNVHMYVIKIVFLNFKKPNY